MADVHLVLCGAARLTTRQQEWRAVEPLRLRLGKGKNDVHLRIDHVTERMCSGLPEIAVDLIEVAAFVYAADQVVTRGGIKEFEYGNRWRRRFRFEIPVRCLEAWKRPEVTAALAETLGFLSDDDYEFAFTRMENPPSLTRYLFDRSHAESARDFQEVLLFSGGLDSLGGAIQEILQGQRKVALVSHRPVSKIYSRQRALVAEIESRLASPWLRPLHVPIVVNKGKSLGRDFTQRTRSFLFATVAAVVARLFHLRRIRFYENGVTSLNLPISPQVLGGRASRTTHPQVLNGFGRIFSQLFGCQFTVENPFLWKTKADILAEIRAAGHGKLCAYSSSCMHTLGMTTMHTHCGRCSQCVDRRVNALAAGLDEKEDPPEMYESDVLTSPQEGAGLMLIERYIGSALQIERIKNLTEFTTAFGEVSRVLGYLGVWQTKELERVFDLYRRHAHQIFHALAGVIQRESAGIVRRAYPPNCLLSIACGQSAAALPADQGIRSDAASLEAQTKLVLDEEMFEARFTGKTCFLGNTKEYWLLARLNQRPGRYVSNAALRQDVWPNEDPEKNTIQRTVSNLRRRLKESEIIGIKIEVNQKDHYKLVLQQ